MTELDKKLQQMASTNWPGFVKLLGQEAITDAKICYLRGQKQSYTQISNKLNISYKVVRSRCGGCDDQDPCEI